MGIAWHATEKAMDSTDVRLAVERPPREVTLFGSRSRWTFELQRTRRRIGFCRDLYGDIPRAGRRHVPCSVTGGGAAQMRPNPDVHGVP